MGSIVKEKVQKAGKEVVRYRAYVRRVGFKSQSKCFETQSEARAWLRNAESDAAQKSEQPERLYPFADVVEMFVATPPRRGTKFWIPAHLAYWNEQFGTRDIRTITRADINFAVARLQAKRVERGTFSGAVKQTSDPISGATVNRYLASLSAVFNFTVDAGLVERHPIKGGQVRKLTEGSGRRRILTDEEQEKLVSEAEKSTWPPMALFLRLALTTGARKSELRGLRWADIDLERRVAILPKTKNGEARALPLVVQVRDELAALKQIQGSVNEFVFFDPKDCNKPKNVDTIWRHVRKRAGLESDRDDRMERIVLHSTRHTAATKLIRGGASVIQAAAVTGHKTVGMLKKYTHLGAEDIVSLADRLLKLENTSSD